MAISFRLRLQHGCKLLFGCPEGEPDFGLVASMISEASHDLEKGCDAATIIIDARTSSDTVQMCTKHDDAVSVAFRSFDEDVIDSLLLPLSNERY
jgi:hypothetical protein